MDRYHRDVNQHINGEKLDTKPYGQQTQIGNQYAEETNYRDAGENVAVTEIKILKNQQRSRAYDATLDDQKGNHDRKPVIAGFQEIDGTVIPSAPV